MIISNKGMQKLIASGIALLLTLTALFVTALAILSTEKMGLSVNVSFDPAVTAKVYLATNSSTDINFKQPNDTVTAGNFAKANSALILDTKDGGTLQKEAFELLGAGNGLKCDANGEMEFYVYVENYSTTESVYSRADINFTDNEISPFNTITNPSFETAGTAIDVENPSISLLTFKIKSTNETGLNANTIQIEIEMNTSAPSLEELSWSTIEQISEAGLASQIFNIGDEKIITLSTDEQITLVILGFDHDDKTNESGKAGITFGMKDLLATTYNMNSSPTNSGGWNSSLMRSRMATFLTTMPSDLQSAIKTINKTAADKLFLFSKSEIDGLGTTEGTQYAYWQGKGTSDKIKRLSNGTGLPNDWWLRSPYTNAGNNCWFYYINSTGGVSSNLADATRGVCFGFCV